MPCPARVTFSRPASAASKRRRSSARIEGEGREVASEGNVADVTSRDYLVTMKAVRIADLKARLSEHLRAVRKGHSITVLDRDTPIARLVPYEPDATGLVVRRRRGKTPFGKVRLPPPFPTDVDIVKLLLEDRRRGR
jgi:prevent-host-death family protein